MSFTETEKNILRALVLKGPSWHYQLWKERKVAGSNKAVLENLHSLLEKRLIQKIGEKEASGTGLGGRNKIVYAVTLPGLFEAIKEFSPQELDEKIDEIAKRHADELPWVFGKWKHFVDSGFREQAILHLKAIPMAYFSRVEYAPRSRSAAFMNALKGIVTEIFLFGEFRLAHFYDVPSGPFFDIDDAEFSIKELDRMTAWLQMLMLDPELRELVKKEFDWLIKDASNYLKALKKIRSLTIEA